uniref:SRR1-like domain-containing protein n=1 Tax=Romanomermis culicivorax TaxID=13658 RepID=A0A915IPN5_ROMCU
MESNNDFILVKRGRRKCVRKSDPGNSDTLPKGLQKDKATDDFDVDSFKSTLANRKSRVGDFVDEILRNRTLSNYLERFKYLNIACYGLGKFSRCSTARCQLALLLVLIDKLNSKFDMKISFVKCFDPIFNNFEKCWISDNFLISKSEMANDRCLYTGKNDEDLLTLFYMPHSGRPMYNNVLYANWSAEQLSRICVFGNTFSTIIQQRLFHSKNNRSLKNLHATVENQLVEEIILPDFDAEENVFNDTAIHIFRKTNLTRFDFQKNTFEQPIYDSVTEIILD